MGKNIGRLQMRVFLEEFVRRLPHMRLVEAAAGIPLQHLVPWPAQLWVEWTRPATLSVLQSPFRA